VLDTGGRMSIHKGNLRSYQELPGVTRSYEQLRAEGETSRKGDTHVRQI
jgi:hypothetical protein